MWLAAAEPCTELRISLEETAVPQSETGGEPGELVSRGTVAERERGRELGERERGGERERERENQSPVKRCGG
jgi:hypothetical protein